MQSAILEYVYINHFDPCLHKLSCLIGIKTNHLLALQNLIKILTLLLVLARILTRAKPSKYESVAIVGTHHAMPISWRKVLAIICNCVVSIVHSICRQLVTLFANA